MGSKKAFFRWCRSYPPHWKTPIHTDPDPASSATQMNTVPYKSLRIRIRSPAGLSRHTWGWGGVSLTKRATAVTWRRKMSVRERPRASMKAAVRGDWPRHHTSSHPMWRRAHAWTSTTCSHARHQVPGRNFFSNSYMKSRTGRHAHCKE